MSTVIVAKPRIEIPTRCPDCGKWRTPRLRKTIRSPRRFLPRWGRPRSIVNVAGVQVDGDGAVKINSDGAEIVAEPEVECCCSGATCCLECTDGPHPSIIATFADVEIFCAGCNFAADVIYRLDGSFTLPCDFTVSAHPCVWAKYFDITNVYLYDDGDTDCSEDPIDSSTQIWIRAKRLSSTNWEITAEGISSFVPIRSRFFEFSGAVSGANCQEDFTVDNQLAPTIFPPVADPCDNGIDIDLANWHGTCTITF